MLRGEVIAEVNELKDKLDAALVKLQEVVKIKTTIDEGIEEVKQVIDRLEDLSFDFMQLDADK